MLILLITHFLHNKLHPLLLPTWLYTLIGTVYMNMLVQCHCKFLLGRSYMFFGMISNQYVLSNVLCHILLITGETLFTIVLAQAKKVTQESYS